MKSAIYIVNTTGASGLASGETLPLGNIARRFGCNIGVNGNSVVLNGTGYYTVEMSATVTPSADDTVTIQMYNNGVALNGAKVSTQGADAMNVSLPAIVRQTCCASPGVITFEVTADISTTTVTLNNLSLVVTKV